MTPKIVRSTIEGFWDRRKNDWERAEYQAWVTGYYTMYSVGVNFSTKIKYPKNPMKTEDPIDVESMDENELADRHEKMLLQLDFMAKNAMKGRQG